MIDASLYDFEGIHQYGIYDEDGFLIGIKDDAPQEIKDSYELYIHDYEEALKMGIKI